MSLVDDLKAAKALIEDPAKWGKGMASWERAYSEPAAFPLCAYGACRAANVMTYVDVGAALQQQLPEPFATMDVAVFNDDPRTTHADIMALFDRAIANAALSTAESKK